MDRSHDIAWAAGFLDGEGCFTLSRCGRSGLHPSTRYAVVVVTQIRREPLDKLVELFGGEVKISRVNYVGHTVWLWRASGAVHVRQILEEVMPYLVLKKREAEIVLEYAQTIRRRGRTPVPDDEIQTRFRLINEMREIRAA